MQPNTSMPLRDASCGPDLMLFGQGIWHEGNLHWDTYPDLPRCSSPDPCSYKWGLEHLHQCQQSCKCWATGAINGCLSPHQLFRRHNNRFHLSCCFPFQGPGFHYLPLTQIPVCGLCSLKHLRWLAVWIALAVAILSLSRALYKH